MGPKNLFHIANYSILAFSILTTINKKKIKERNLGLAIVIPYCRDFLIRGYDITGVECISLYDFFLKNCQKTCFFKTCFFKTSKNDQNLTCKKKQIDHVFLPARFDKNIFIFSNSSRFFVNKV